MILKLTKDQVEKFVKLYYEKYEGTEVQISSKASSGCTGIQEIPCTHVGFVVTQEIEFLGEKIISERTLSEKDMDQIFKTILQEEGYQVNYISYDAGTTTGDYFDRGTKTYFNGIQLNVSEVSFKKPKCLTGYSGV